MCIYQTAITFFNKLIDSDKFSVNVFVPKSQGEKREAPNNKTVRFEEQKLTLTGYPNLATRLS